jgi:NDP-sugar pyrophosphorylase family protein
MPLGDYPILEIILRQLKRAGVNQAILAVGYMGQLFQAFFGNGSRYNLEIRYSLEEKPLGTAGPIALAMDQLEDDFIVMNGDLLTTLNFKDLFIFHKRKEPAATMGLFHREVKIDFGVIESDADQRLVHYHEKPRYAFDVSMGVNVMNKKAVRPYLTPGEYLDIPELMSRLVERGETVLCYKELCSWLDIGRMDDYQQALELFEQNKALFLPEE